MTDEDGDKVFEYKMEVDPAISGSKFIFLKGNCGDWRCKENLVGKKCADPDNWHVHVAPPTDTVRPRPRPVSVSPAGARTEHHAAPHRTRSAGTTARSPSPKT